MRKLVFLVLSLFAVCTVFGSCHTQNPPSNPPPENPPPVIQPPDGSGDEEFSVSDLPQDIKTNLSAGGYVKDKIDGFSQYENTSAYRKVKTVDELVAAIKDAQCHYNNIWDEESKTYTQVPAAGYTQENFAGKVRVIEIENDLNLGYYTLSESVKASGLVDDFCSRTQSSITSYTMSADFSQNGASQIKIENVSNLLVYSKNGAKLTHGGFKLTSDNNVVFRNLQFDELWQWEDTSNRSVAKVGDYDAFGWAYFKISFCGYIWIDHCSFGKSYDGQIDYSNPVYNANALTAFRAPYGADGNNGLHISYCSFGAGSADEDGYIYKMMSAIEKDYKSGGGNYLYYGKLRDCGASFEDILHGLAVPQKKGFLCGDDATFSGSYDNADDYNFNLKLRVSFANCVFKNLEDRLPKLRGGNAYMYNCMVDNSEYYSYRARLQSIGAKDAFTQINSTWKCALVSQGIVCGNGGSVAAENCSFEGIEYLLKNNDKKNTGKYVEGGYRLINCSYRKAKSDAVYIGSSSDPLNRFVNDTPDILKAENFKWNTADGEKPFEPALIDLDNAKANLFNENYGAGVSVALKDDFLKTVY